MHVIRRGARAGGGMGDAVGVNLESAAFAAPQSLLFKSKFMHVISNGHGLAVMGFCNISQVLGHLSLHCRSSQLLVG